MRRHLFLWFLVACALTGSAHAAQVTLAWDHQDNSDVAVGFYIYKQPNCTGPFTVVQTQSVSLKTWTDTQLQLGDYVCYATTAVDAQGRQSTYSNVLPFRVQETQPAAPSALRVMSTAFTHAPKLMNMNPPPAVLLPDNPCPAWGTVRRKHGMMVGCGEKAP